FGSAPGPGVLAGRQRRQEAMTILDLWPMAPPSTTDWLLDLCGDGLTGFLPPPQPDAAWVLNAMYEHEQGPAEVSVPRGPPGRAARRKHPARHHRGHRLRGGGRRHGRRPGPRRASRPGLAAPALGGALPPDRRPHRARRRAALLPVLPLDQ